MKVYIARDALLKGLQSIYPIVPNKSTLPILSHVLLDAHKEGLHLVGTDLELGISCSVAAETQEEGAVAVPAKRLMELVKELPSNTTLQLTAKKNQQVTIECDIAGKHGLFKAIHHSYNTCLSF